MGKARTLPESLTTGYVHVLDRLEMRIGAKRDERCLRNQEIVCSF